MSYKRNTISGVIWSFTDFIVLKGIVFGVGLFLARLLGPAEFGLMGMISVFMAIGIILIDSGLSASIIRTKSTDDSDYSTVFYTNLFISLILYILIFVLAPSIAAFYNQEILIKAIRLYCLGFVISALSSVQLALLNKEMVFRKILMCNIPGTLLGVLLGVILGLLGYGIWSIIWMYLSTQFVQAATLWIFSSWKPSLNFSFVKFKIHFNFGYKLMLSGIIDTVFKNIYNVLIGRFYSVQSLGYFERATTFNDYPVLAITGILSKVTYPLLSKLQEEQVEMSRVYIYLLQFSFFIVAPIMLGAAAVAKPLFLFILGQEWLPTVPFFQILCLASIFYPIHSFNINVLKVFGRSDLFLKLELVKKCVLGICVIVAFQFGILALVWSTVFSSLIALIINMYYSRGMINYSITNQLLIMAPVLIKAILMASFMFFQLFFLDSYPLIFQIIVPVVSGIIFYLIMNYLGESEILFYILDLVKNYRNII